MILLDPSDIDLIATGQSDYIFDKGVECYKNQEFADAYEYFLLTLASGDKKISAQAAKYIGYCYLYGRYARQNISLAIAYLSIAAEKGNVEATYKLGNLFARDQYVDRDDELSLSYYKRTVEAIEQDDDESPYDYPALYYFLAKEYLPDGRLDTNIDLAREYLQITLKGSEIAVIKGKDYYKYHCEKARALLSSEVFNKEINR